MTVEIDDEALAAARELIDQIEAEMLEKGFELQTIEQLALAHRAQVQISEQRAFERRAAEHMTPARKTS